MDQRRARPEDMRHRVDARPQGRVHQVRIALGRLHLRVTQQFADQSNGAKMPDSRSIRRRITPIWNALH